MSRNPLHGSNRLKLGIFATNGRSPAISLVPELYQATWPLVIETARLADEAGLEAIVPYARWKGYHQGQPDHPTGMVLEPFTWAAGVAQATRHSAVFATSHAPTVHPIMAAKMAATVDIISGGRFALNVVGGWNKPELEMFGAPLREHDARYDQLAEWLHIVRNLWRSHDEFDFAGDFYSILRGSSMPKPIQSPGPPIMNAGGSPRGRAFACEHADLCFMLVKSEEPDRITGEVQQYKREARENHGREIQVWTVAYVVQRDSRKEAHDYLHHYAVEQEDVETADAWMKLQGEHAMLMPPDTLSAFRRRFVEGSGGFPLVGTAENITDRLTMLSRCGIDGVLLIWVDYVDGLTRFTRDALPLIEEAGLRTPFECTAREAAAAGG